MVRDATRSTGQCENRQTNKQIVKKKREKKKRVEEEKPSKRKEEERKMEGRSKKDRSKSRVQIVIVIGESKKWFNETRKLRGEYVT